MGRLEGKTAIVAGAGRGIGRAIALAFARESARVVLCARTYAELEAVQVECEALGAEALIEVADIADQADVERVVSAARAPDILVVAAGIYGPIGPTWDVDPVQWMRAIEVNLVGPFLLCRAATAHMVEQGSGKIVLLGGGGATAPLPRFSAYAASKAGLVRFAETLAEEVKPHVQVNVIAPGLVDTTLQNDVLAAGERAGALFEKIREARDTGAGAIPPDRAAELSVFLASPDSGALTGKLISAPHDPWPDWGERAAELNESAIYTIRRLDPFTVRPLVEILL